MKANFVKSLRLVGESEGGWADHPKDPGGATMKGITLRVFAAYCKNRGRKTPTKEDLRKISDEDVRDIYKQQYWDAVNGDDLPAGIDFAAFDFAVNSGSGQAIKELQRCVGADADGKMGELTQSAVASAYKRNREKLINDYLDRRLAFFKKLKTWGTFGKGWTNRVKLVRKNALAMARRQPTEGFEQPDANEIVLPEDQENAGATKGNPADVAVTRTNTGKSIAGTIASAAATGATVAGEKILDAAGYAEFNVIPYLIGGFVILTIIGAVIAAIMVKRRAQNEGVI